MSLLWLIVVVLLVVYLLGALPRRFSSPVDILVFVVVIILIMWLLGARF